MKKITNFSILIFNKDYNFIREVKCTSNGETNFLLLYDKFDLRRNKSDDMLACGWNDNIACMKAALIVNEYSSTIYKNRYADTGQNALLFVQQLNDDSYLIGCKSRY